MASRSWNRVELIGNLTRDPELRYTPNGAAVCTFGLATNRTYVSEGEKREEVDFHRLVAWNKLAEICNQFLRKGHKVFVSGRLQTRTWEGQDGQSRQTTEIVIEDMIILTPKTGGEPYAASVPEPVEESALDASSKQSRTMVEESAVKDVKEKVKNKDEKTASSSPPAVKEEPQTPPQEEVKEDLPF